MESRVSQEDRPELPFSPGGQRGCRSPHLRHRIQAQNPKPESEWGNLTEVGRGPGAISEEASLSTADNL